ncbi:MAG: PAS domain S-box protein, partial [Nitrospira sp.]|nr:PAS domain S-box protein [Nitrospira sp.]
GGRRWMETHAVPFRNPGTGSIEHLAVTHDITERKQAEKALRENEQAIRALHEATAVIGLSFDERIQAILEVGCRRFTMPIGMLTQAVGERLVFTHVCAPGTGFTAGMEAPLGNTYCNTTLQRNKPVYFEHAGVSDWRNHPGYKALGLESYIGTKLIGREQAYGTICFAGQDPHPAPFSQSDEDFIQLMARWISGELDRQQAEQALKHSEERYRSLYDDTPTMYFTLATDGTVRSVNRFGAEQLLYQVEELIGHSVLGLFHEDDKETVAASLSECLATPETTKHWEFRKVRKDGSLLWVRETVKVGQSSTRETVVLVTCEDVTERKRTEQALTFFRTLLDYVNDSIEIIDPQTGKFLDGNKGAASNIGYTRDELLGLTVPDIDPLVTPPIFADVMKRLREEPGPLVLDSIHRRKDGTTFPVEVSAQLIRLEKDYCVAIVRDSTERKRAEHEVSERIQQTLQMQAALLRLTHLDDTGVPFSDVLPRVCEIVAETLGVARVSVWQLSENGTELVCQNLYDRSHAVHSAGNRLSALQYPRYLETIAASLVAAAPDACADPRMSEFVEHYFRPLGITSVMDVPIRHQGTLVGVLWHEHVGVPRDWNSEAQSFGVSVGEILGRMMETVERTRAEEALRSSEERDDS